MKVWFFILILLSFAFQAGAVPPALSEPARKESKADPEVVREDVDKMKEDVINKKAQLKLFHQLLKTEAIESSFPILNISHINEMSSRYKVFSMTYSIDNDRVYTYYLEDGIGKQGLGRETSVFKGPVVPGTHDLTIEVVYKGNDTGVFSYINDYKIPIVTKKNFKVDKGQTVLVEVVAYEKGWALTEFKDRPDLKVKFNSTQRAKDLR